MKNIAIILAGGSGSRFGDETPKQFIILHGRRVIDYSVNIFYQHNEIDEIIISCPPNWIDIIQNEYPNCKVVKGGKTRKDSSYNGLKACPKDTNNVLIHDAARPFIDKDIISRCLNSLKNNQAVDTVISSSDTIVEAKKNIITNMPIRDNMFLGQTPQAFNFKTIIDAHKKFKGETTDDIRLVKELGIKCATIEGSVYNFKLTNQPDIYLAERITQIQSQKNNLVPDFSNKNVLIFGGTGGIGSGVGTLLKNLGAKVTCLGSEIDLRLNKLPKKLYNDKYDIIIHSAGIFRMKSLFDSTIDDWDDMFNVNLRSSFLVSKLAIKTLNNPGWLIYIGSSSSHHGRANQAIYASSKAGLNNLTQSLSAELQIRGIRVNCINPPRTNTPMREKAFPNEDKSLLADPLLVAKDILQYCSGNETGHIVNLKYTSQANAKR